MRGAMQIASAESKGGGSVQFRTIDQSGAIIGNIIPFQREVPRYPFLVTAVRQAHLVTLSRVDVQDVLSNFEGDDCKNVLRVLREEHQVRSGSGPTARHDISLLSLSLPPLSSPSPRI